jgi:hypothetical protein
MLDEEQVGYIEASELLETIRDNCESLAVIDVRTYDFNEGGKNNSKYL